jgi:phosphohistidine phosphatase
VKELYLIRHAKSSWDYPQLKDFDRPLNERGEEDAPLMGKVLKENNILPQLILSSPAKRALNTAQIIAKALGYPSSKIEELHSIYHGEMATLMDLLNGIDNQYETVFVFGHNPTFTYLAEELGGEYIGNLPTCGVVGIRFEIDDWALLSKGLGTQIYYDYPKRHK